MLTGTYGLPAASRDAYRASNLSKRTPRVPSAVSKARNVSSHSFVFRESHAIQRFPKETVRKIAGGLLSVGVGGSRSARMALVAPFRLLLGGQCRPCSD